MDNKKIVFYEMRLSENFPFAIFYAFTDLSLISPYKLIAS